MYIEEIKPGFPDCIGRRFVGKGWERIAIEFEYKSSNFVAHGHDANECDMIICWEHDWKACPLEVIELKSEIQGLDNYPIQKPGVTEKEEINISDKLEAIFKAQYSLPKVREWYDTIIDGISEADDTIWAKVSTKYIGLYSPEKAFASIKIKKTTLRIACFSRGEVIEGTTVVNAKRAPRWVKFTVKSEADIIKAIDILKLSHDKIKKAIRNGETTGYFSGGENSGLVEELSEDDDS